MGAQAMRKDEREAIEREAAIEARVMEIAREHWARLSKLDPGPALLSAIEVGLRARC